MSKQPLSYTHRTSRKAKHLTIKIEPDGQVIVVTPPRVSQKQIDHFVTSKQDWIKATLIKINSRKTLIDHQSEILVFGKKFTKIVTSTTQHSMGVIVRAKTILINTYGHPSVGKTSNKRAAQTLLVRFLKNTAQKYIVPRTHQFSSLMDISLAKIVLREQKTRWGSCSSTGTLSFNWRLAHHSTKIIDYVIIHELAHRHQPNHSLAFWRLVQKYDPEYRIHRGWLKRNGHCWSSS